MFIAHLSEFLIPLIALLGAGLFAGFCAGTFGIGGGFVVVPALFLVLPLLGGTQNAIAHVAIGTSVATIIATSIRSLRSHAKRGSVEFDVLWTWMPWIILGATLGVMLAGHVDGHWLTLIFALGVACMSLYFLLPKVGDTVISSEMPSGVARASIASGLGAFSCMLGIGQRHTGLPWGSEGYVNMPAAVLIASMSILTAPLGVAVAHSLSPKVLKRTFGVYLVIISAVMLNKSLQMG